MAVTTHTVKAQIEYFSPGYFLNLNATNVNNNGTVQNVTPSGDAYIAKATCVTFQGNSAFVAAQLQLQTVPSWGPWVYIKLVDNGNAQQLTDVIFAEFTSKANANSKCNNKLAPANGPWPVLVGDVVVQ